MVLPATSPPQAATMRVGHALFARVVGPHHGLDDRQRRLGLARGAHQRAAVLGKARAAIAGPGMQEFAADAAVEADAAGHVLHIGADLLAQIGDLVDEGDLGREKGVGRVFDQFGGFDVGEHDRRFDQIERAVERPHHRAGGLAVGADDDAVGAHEILDRRAFAQKFGVGDDVEPRLAGARRRRIAATSRPVPTGTVDLVTTTV